MRGIEEQQAGGSSISLFKLHFIIVINYLLTTYLWMASCLNLIYFSFNTFGLLILLMYLFIIIIINTFSLFNLIQFFILTTYLWINILFENDLNNFCSIH